MAEHTTNYNLEKQQGNEFVNIEGINGNFDIIDNEIKTAQDKADQAFQSASNGKAAIKAAITGLDPEVTIPTNATFAQLAAAIGQIETGVDTEDATATAAQILAGMTAYVKSVKVTGTMVNRGPASAETVNLTSQNQEYTIASGFHSGLRKIKAVISGLVANVIKAGTTVGGIFGTFTSDATAIAGEILLSKTGYVNGNKVTGTMPNQAGKSLGIANHAANMTVVVDAGDSRMGVIDLPNQYPVTGYVDASTHFLAQLWGLIPDNIRAGVVVGQYPGYGNGNMAGSFTADANAAIGDILYGKTAYVNGNKVTGNIPVLGSEEYYGWRRATISAPPSSGRVHLRIPLGAYLSGAAEQGGQLGVFCDDPAFTPANILNTANIFGMQGAAVAGKRFATGMVTSSAANAGTFYDGATYERLRPYVSVSGLTFTPSRIIVMSYGSDFTYITMYDSNGVITGNDSKIAVMTCKPFYENGTGHLGAFKMSGTASVSGTGFVLPCDRALSVHTWFAYE